MAKQSKWWEYHSHRTARCDRCKKTLKGRRSSKDKRQYCYWCGRRQGLW